MISISSYEKSIVALLAAGQYAGADEMLREVAALLATGYPGLKGKQLFMQMYMDWIAQAQEQAEKIDENRDVFKELKNFEALSTKKIIVGA